MFVRAVSPRTLAKATHEVWLSHLVLLASAVCGLWFVQDHRIISTCLSYSATQSTFNYTQITLIATF